MPVSEGKMCLWPRRDLSNVRNDTRIAPYPSLNTEDGNTPANRDWIGDLFMKSLLLVGGLLGFAVGAGFSFMEADSGPSILLHGCVTAYVAALLARWWGRSWRKSLDEALTASDVVSGPSFPQTTPKISK